MDMSAINWLAVLVAALIPFALGFVWYGPLFGKPWLSSIGLTVEDGKNMNPAKVFGTSFVAQFIMAFCLAMFFYGDPAAADAITASTGVFYGFLTGFGWVSMVIYVNSQFELRSFSYIVSTGSYWTVLFTLMGLVLGAWK